MEVNYDTALSRLLECNKKTTTEPYDSPQRQCGVLESIATESFESSLKTQSTSILAFVHSHPEQDVLSVCEGDEQTWPCLILSVA